MCINAAAAASRTLWPMSGGHVVYDPEWMIDARGSGSFRVECQCGWDASGFDTASSAKKAGFDHSTGGAAKGETTPPPRRRRFWRT